MLRGQDTRRGGAGGGNQTLPTFSVNLFGIPEIPEALPSAISPARLHNIVFIPSCNLVRGASNPFPQPLAGGVTSFSRRVSCEWRHIRDPRNGLYGLQGDPPGHPRPFLFASFLSV